jgi:hypothetical protein
VRWGHSHAIRFKKKGIFFSTKEQSGDKPYPGWGNVFCSTKPEKARTPRCALLFGLCAVKNRIVKRGFISGPLLASGPSRRSKKNAFPAGKDFFLPCRIFSGNSGMFPGNFGILPGNFGMFPENAGERTAEKWTVA